MKKYFLSLVAIAAAMLFATSCQESLVEPQIEGPTTFTVQLPDGMGTKAFGDEASTNQTINKLYVQVYDESGNNSLVKLEPISVKTAGTAAFEFSLDLVRGAKYDIILWAQNENAKYNVGSEGSDLRTILMTNQHHNSELGAAFYAIINNYDPENDADRKQDVVLTRPFAQLNIGTELTSDHGELTLVESKVTVAKAAGKLDRVAGEEYMVGTGNETTFTYTSSTDKLPTAEPLKVAGKDYAYVSMDYLAVLGDTKSLVDVTVEIKLKDKFDNLISLERRIESVPVQMNYRTNIVGNLISSTTDFNVTVDDSWAGGYDIENGYVSTEVDSAEELEDAFNNFNEGIVDEIVLGGNINLNDLFNQTKSEVTTQDPTLTIDAGKTLTIDLNGNTLSATSSQTGKNYNMLDVRGTLTVKNGIMVYEHKGENMGWGASTNLFNVTAGGVLNLEGVTAKNLGGSDMGFVVHLNNWGEVTLNAENCTLESNYVPVRVFNSGPDRNNVTIKNSTLKGGSASFWVHNYTKEDFGSQDKADSQKALLNLNIYNQGNKFSPDLNGIRYGFTNSIRTDAYGITKVVSEDGTEVTLGSLIENGLVRRGVAGAEENTTIKNVVVEEGITTLYDRTFRRFYALEEVVLPEGLTTIGAEGTGVFQSCKVLKNIVIPESVTVLGKGTFQECSSLESINIPSGVTRIEADCLRATGLVSVEFHAGVTYFGAQAFRDCKQLTEVIINAPEFTMEGNTFGIMAAPYTPMTIYVANSEMKAYVESKLTDHAKTYITVVSQNTVSNSDELAQALSEQKEYIVLSNDIYSEAATIAPYGNKYGYKMDGGILDGNGHELDIECYGDDYGIMTSGGTIKNLTIDNGTRAVMIMYVEDDVILDNVCLGGEGVLYPINTGEVGDASQTAKLIVSNSTLAGWTSYSNISSASFTNVEFKQGTYYNNIYGRVLKPYVNTTLTNCSFIAHMNLDLSGLTNGHKIVIENCTVNGQLIAADVFTVPSCDNDYDTKLFTVDLPSWATNISDCIEVK